MSAPPADRAGDALPPESRAPTISHRTPSLWSMLAGGVMATHLIVSLYMVFGGLLVVRGPLAWWMHVPLAAWGVFVHAANFTCPLTPLEKRFRGLAGEPVYEAGFVQRYIAPRALQGRTLDWVVVSLLLVVNTIVYTAVR